MMNPPKTRKLNPKTQNKTYRESETTMTRKTWNAQSIIAAAALAVALPVAFPEAAKAQEACSVYTVKAGDSLGAIANTAYGTFDYQQVFNANRNIIVNPNTLEVGTVLQLPCADGNLPNAATAQEIIQQNEARQAATAKTSSSFEPPIKIVSGNGWAPFVGEQFEGGGMLVRLATTALNRGGNAREYTVSFVDDWAAHYETLLPLGAFDISIAWYIPDCTKVDLLSEGMTWRCTEIDASLPIYESVVGVYTLPGNQYENVRNHSDLAGATICRMEGFFTHDLEVRGLKEPVVTMVRPKTIEECFDKLMEGEVDVLALEIESVAGTAAELGLADKIVENPYLNDILTMSFVAHKTNPRGRVYLAMLNRGLTEMRESGEWYAIISSGLAEYNKLRQATN